MNLLTSIKIEKMNLLLTGILVIAPITVATSATLAENSESADELVSRYEITISADNPSRAHVSARLLATDTLTMSTNCPNYDYPEGWATFVSNLVVTNQNNEVSTQYVSKSEWSLASSTAGPVEIEYDLDLSYTMVDWEVGNEQGGYFDGQAVYTVSKALFMHGENDESFIVKLNIPDSWDISVPWLQIGEDNEFSVPNLEALLENSLVYGKYAASSVVQNGFQFEFALLGDASESSELFDVTFKKIASEYMAIFPDTAPSKFLVTMFYSDQDDGESFLNSNAFTLAQELSPDGSIVWANQMAHELFHYWSSDLIKAANYDDRQWFSEGFSEYYSNLTLLRSGIIDEPTYRNKVEKIIGLYLNFKWRNPEITLKDAGKNKGRNRFAVYNGGWVAALTLDLLIIENTNGARNLDDFMRKMFDKYNEDSYEYSDLVETASEVAGADLSDFFSRYVNGIETIPVEESLTKIGYRTYDIVYEAEVYLVPLLTSEYRDHWMRVKEH